MAGVCVQEMVNDKTGEVEFRFRGIVGCYLLEGSLKRGEGNVVTLEARDVILGIEVKDELVVLDKEIVGDRFYLRQGKGGSTWLNLRTSEPDEKEVRGLWR